MLVPYLESLGYDLTAFERESAVDYIRDQRRGSDDSYLHRYNMEDFGYWWMENLQRRTENFGIRTFNLSRYHAMRLLEGKD